MTLPEWLERIERQHPSAIALGLDRVRAVAGRMRLPRPAKHVVVVGGTNGKGSTVAFIEAIARAAGWRTGAYTSPHLAAYNERVRVDGRDAGDDALVAGFEAVEAARGDTPLTYFEYGTLAALWSFARERLDLAVLEVGLGGRLDAVNVVDADCAVLTSIDLDHQDYLGDTRDTIGFEKAHIFRRGRPAICCDPQPPATVAEVAAAIGADLWLFGRDFNYQGDRQQWAYGGRHKRRSGLPYPALRGANQLLNASGALAALEALGDRLPVSQQAVRQGLLTVEIPARFQVLPGRPTIVLDVAHNPHAAAVLARNLESQGFFPRTFAVFGMLADKDVAGTVARVRDQVDAWFAAPTPGARGLSAEALVEQLRAAGVTGDGERTVETFASIEEAFGAAVARAQPDDRILAFGSFVTIAAVMRVLPQYRATALR